MAVPLAEAFSFRLDLLESARAELARTGRAVRRAIAQDDDDDDAPPSPTLDPYRASAAWSGT